MSFDSNIKYNILVVNDSRVVKELIVFILQQHGYTTCEANNGAECIKRATELQPDLILLDIIMPEMDGYEVCSKLKNEESTKDIPIIFLSSLNSTHDKVKGLHLGGVDFINNSTDKEELLVRVETQLKIKSLTENLRASNKELLNKQMLLNEDLKAARFIQRGLLPSSSVNISGVDIAWEYLPAFQIGGDLIDIIRFNDEKTLFYILDVSGHNVPSAMITVSISQFLREHAVSSDTPLSPKQMLQVLNKEYPFDRYERFFTIFYLLFDKKAQAIFYSAAAHPPTIFLREGEPLELIDIRGMLMGINPSSVYEQAEKSVRPGDKLIAYTDGIIEFKNVKGEQFGAQRLYDAAEKYRKENVRELKDKIIQTLRDFSDEAPQDDISLMCIEFL